MLKLVTQFDSKESKISLATPTCGGCCCCCCCCLVSTIMVSAVSARSFAGEVYTERIKEDGTRLKEEVGKDKLARVFFILLLFLFGAVIALLASTVTLLLHQNLFIVLRHHSQAVIGLLIALGVSVGLYRYIFSRLLKKGYSAKDIIIRKVFTLLAWALLVAVEFSFGIFLVMYAPMVYLVFVIAAVIAAIVLMVRD